jgi:hypothetical protein
MNCIVDPGLIVPPEAYWVVSVVVTDEPEREAWVYSTAVLPLLLTTTVRVPESPGISTSGSRVVFVTDSPDPVDDPDDPELLLVAAVVTWETPV